MGLKNKSFEIFCGTGGVGKTTLATSRAINLCKQGKKVLLVTIDPAKRLKDILGLTQENVGELSYVNINDVSLTALLMSPEKTIQRMAARFNTPDLASNRIVQILAKPYGGMNEILSLVEVQMQFESGNFDCIVLDTPPGSHFLDFLEGITKIKKFFDENFIEIFNYLSEKTARAGKKVFGINIIGKFISAGVKKLLSYLQHVTGAKFIDDFILAIKIIYESRESFMKGIKLQDRLKSKDECNWFLVTSVEQGKAQEALELKTHATHFIHEDHYLILNKCLENELRDWIPNTPDLSKLKESLFQREVELKTSLHKSFKYVFDFPEITNHKTEEQIKILTSKWDDYVIQN